MVGGETLSGDGVWLANRNYGSRTDDAVRHLGLTFDRRWGGLQATVGFDWMNEERTVLGARFHDAFGGGGAQTMFVDLGRLKAFKGSQNYAVPAGVDIAQYKSVVIWCEQFGVLISPARLTFR